jgi:AcrR family transcriptional regulator
LSTQHGAPGEGPGAEEALKKEGSIRQGYRRARRDAEKTERRHAILAAAHALLCEIPLESLSMAVLAAKSGIAKGTLYLYFETREEVLLALWVERLEAWGRRLSDALHDGMADEAFARSFLAASLADPTFLPLRARLDSVIEHNVSREKLIESKRTMRDLLVRLAPSLERCLRLRSGDGVRALTALATLLLGASASHGESPFDPADLPGDVVEFMHAFHCEDLFLTYAPMLLSGIRAGTQR